MKKTILLALLFVTSFLFSQARENNKQVPSTAKPISFIENKGQVIDQNKNIRNDIQFALHAANGLNVFIGNGAIHYQFSKNESGSTITKNPFDLLSDNTETEAVFSCYRMDVNLVGANNNAQIVKEDNSEYFEQYFTSEHLKDGLKATSYGKITYQNIYPNIDWVLTVRNGQLKHEFVVKEGGHVSDIKLQYGGATKLELLADGNLEASTPFGKITEQAPVSFDAIGNTVKTNFSIQENTVSYQTSSFSGKLIIDPYLAWATYFGGNGLEVGRDIKLDGNGNYFWFGYTQSTNNIATSGAYQTTYSGNSDFFLVKCNAQGVIQWSTYYGGADFETAENMAVDAANNIYIAGRTASAGLGTLNSQGGGGLDAILIKFDNAGGLIWSKYIGGTGSDYPTEILLDNNSNVLMSVTTNSSNNIATSNAYQTVNNGGDAALIKIDSSGNILWGTYFGGSGNEVGYGIEIDPWGNIYLNGLTSSSSNLATANSFQSTYGGGNQDGYLSKWTSSGNLIWSTYFGGTGNDAGYDVISDSIGNVYMTGVTSSPNNIAYNSSYQSSGHGDIDFYVSKFDSSGNIIWSTYSGGPNTYGQEQSNRINKDHSGIIVSGVSGSPTGIATPDGIQNALIPNLSGGYYFAGFIQKFSFDGSLVYGTYLGGSANSFMAEMAVTNDDDIYVSGRITSASSLITPNATQTSYGGGATDGLFIKISNTCVPPVASPIIGGSSVCVGNTLQLNTQGIGGMWSSSDLSKATINSSGTVTAIAAGTVTIKYLLSNSCGSDSVSIPITINPVTSTITSSGSLSLCNGGSVTLNAGLGTNYLWSNNATTQSITVNAAGNYSVTYTNQNGCNVQSNTLTVFSKTLPASLVISIIGAKAVCAPNGVLFSVSPGASVLNGFSYQWSVSGTPISGATDTTFYPTNGSGGVVLTISGSNCSKTSNSLMYSVRPKPEASFAVGGATTFCLGGSVTLTAPPITGYTYTWLNNGVSIGGGISKLIKTSGQFTVIAKLSNCLDTAQFPVNIVVNPLPVASITNLSPTTFCAGDSCLMSALPSASGNSYNWLSGATSVATSTSSTYATTIAGNFKVIVTDANGCVSKASSSIVKTKVNPLPPASINALSSTAIMPGGSVKLNASSVMFATWQWYKDGVAIPGATAKQYIATALGNYTVAATKFGCTAMSAPISVTSSSQKVEAGTTSSSDGVLSITAYPNPVQDVLTVTLSGVEEINGTLEMIDVLGRTVDNHFSKVNNATCNIQTSTLSSGVYFIRYKDNDGRTATLRVTKE